MPQGGTELHSHKRAHRPDNAHAEVVGVLVLALTSVPCERAALLRKEAATTKARGSTSKRSRAENRRRCVLDSLREAHGEERQRHSALEPISSKVPAATVHTNLQPTGPSTPANPAATQVIVTRGKAGLLAYNCRSAVSAEIAAGTLPVKRLP
jgi:hypothetical protein